MDPTIDSLTRTLREFAAQRDWEQFHSPKNLATALAVEAAELLEHFQWLTEEQSRQLAPEQLAAVRQEAADVLLYLLQLADKLGIDLAAAARDKIAINARKYPASLVRGSSRKATQGAMEIAGASNFRDLGHHRTRTGETVVPGRLFRADHLGALTPDDVAQLRALGVRRVLDLRGVNERATVPCALPGVAVHSLAIEPTIVQKLSDLLAAGHRLTPEEVIGHMQDTYRGFVRHNTHRFAELFAHLLERDDPTVFHCTAGKDRTGFAAALVLRSLGVSEADVMRDYLLTNERLKPLEASRHGLAPEVQTVLWRVQPDFLQAALEAVDADYGGMDAYLREGLRLREAELARLRELYLTPRS